MTVDPGWQEVFKAAAHIPGPRKENIRKTADEIALATVNAQKRYASDIAVTLANAVDTGEDFDPWSLLADWGADKVATQDGIVAAILAGSIPGTGAEGVTQAVTAQTLTLLGLSQAVQELQLANGTGQSYVVNFADYADGESESVGVPFDLDYTGTGSGRSWIVDGVSGWHKVVDGDVQLIGRYNGSTVITDSDYQLMRATAAGPMDVGAEEAFCCRMSADKQSYVYIKGYRPSTFSFRCELGCFVSGAKTVFATNVPAGFSLNLAMEAGDFDDTDPYRFQVFSGNSLIIDYTDDDEVSELGALFRGWGFTASTGSGGNAIPASASRVQCSDNS